MSSIDTEPANTSTTTTTTTVKSSPINNNTNENPIKFELIYPDFGKLFYEHKAEFQLCKPHLMPLKSIKLIKLEQMQKDAQKQLQETRSKITENI